MRLAAFRNLPLACMLVLSACGSSEENKTDAAEGAASPPAAANASEPAATPSPAADALGNAENSGAGLAAYVGKWPFDKVNGVTWNDHPAVLAGIRKTVSDAAARKAILELEGPASEIALYQGKVASWACQAHNCGDHQWAVMVDPNSGATDVCYHNAEKLPGKSRWFMANGSVEEREGNCSVE